MAPPLSIMLSASTMKVSPPLLTSSPTAFFPTSENFYLATIFVALTAPFICFPSICLWALFGSSIKMLIKNAKIKKIIEYFLAVLLVITAIIILFN